MVRQRAEVSKKRHAAAGIEPQKAVMESGNRQSRSTRKQREWSAMKRLTAAGGATHEA